MSRAPTVDHALVRELKDAEDARFHAERPRSAELWARAWKVMPNGVPMAWHRGSYHHAPLWVGEGRGARFTDVDVFTHSDFIIADISMFCGYAPEPVVRAVAERMASGNHSSSRRRTRSSLPRSSVGGSACRCGSSPSPRRRRTPKRSGSPASSPAATRC